MRRGTFYDCEPLAYSEIEPLLQSAGLGFTNLFDQAVRSLAGTEARPPLAVRMASRLPSFLLRVLRPLSPTHVYLLRKEMGPSLDG